MSFKKQIMSKDIYNHIFHEMEGTMVTILQIIFETQFLKLGNITRILPSVSWGIFSNVVCLEQSCKNI